MIVSERDVAVVQAQHQDRLREADKQRLIRQLTASDEETTTWRTLGKLVWGSQQAQQTAGGQCCFAEEST